MEPQKIVCILSIIGIVVSLLSNVDFITATFYILVLMVNHKRLLGCYTTMIAYTIILMIIQIVIITAVTVFFVHLKNLAYVQNLCGLGWNFYVLIGYNYKFYWILQSIWYFTLLLKIALLVFMCRARDTILMEDGEADRMIKQQRMQQAQMKKQAQQKQQPKMIKPKKPYDNPCDPSDR